MVNLLAAGIDILLIPLLFYSVARTVSCTKEALGSCLTPLVFLPMNLQDDITGYILAIFTSACHFHVTSPLPNKVTHSSVKDTQVSIESGIIDKALGASHLLKE